MTDTAPNGDQDRITDSAARSSHVSRDIYDQLRESRDWWKSEWEHKNREADMWFGWCIALAFLCGVCFFMGTVIA